MSASSSPPASLPSPSQIQREYSNLRELRRRSVSTEKGALIMDPDLPELSPISPSNPMKSPVLGKGYWSTLPEGEREEPPAELTTKPEEDGADDPSNLFWVPAHLHPELAPTEFRAFLKAHTRSVPQTLPPASVSPLSTTHAQAARGAEGLGRKKSMLSRQYRPSANDGVENEPSPAPSHMASTRRNRSSIFWEADGPQLTIDDLQKLEALAEEASMSDDPSKLRKVLRRSLSLNVPPSFIDTIDDIAQVDEADEPIIVPRPGQTLRRAARTKIRKPSLVGDGGGHRFPATRRERRRPSDAGMDEEVEERPISYSDETSIFDSYAAQTSPDAFSDDGHGEGTIVSSRTPSEQDHEQAVVSLAPAVQLTPVEVRLSPAAVVTAPPPPLQHPAPQRHLSVPPSATAQPARTPSPSHRFPSPTPSSAASIAPSSPSPALSASAETASTAAAHTSTPVPHAVSPPPTAQQQPTSSRPTSVSPTKPAPATSPPTKEKKGGLFSKSKKDNKLTKAKAPDSQRSNGSPPEKEKEKEKEREREKEKEKEKEKEGFFGSLFGVKKKVEEPHSSLFSGAAAGQAAAQALLGASKSSKNHLRPPSPSQAGLNNYSRYPIHVERAVYRLSHIKLASPRRPLYEQVLISNLMFWYLGIINRPAGEEPPKKPANSESAPPSEVRTPALEHRSQAPGTPGSRPSERDSLIKRGSISGAVAKAPSPPGAQIQRPSSPPAPSPGPGPKQGNSLNHHQRPAEMPIRAPQYDVQHRMIASGQAPPPQQHGTPPQKVPQQPVHPHSPPPGAPGGPGGPGRMRSGSPPPMGMNPFMHQHPQNVQYPPQHPSHPQHLQHHPHPPHPSHHTHSQQPPHQQTPQQSQPPAQQGPHPQQGPQPPGPAPGFHLPNRTAGGAPRRANSASAAVGPGPERPQPQQLQVGPGYPGQPGPGPLRSPTGGPPGPMSPPLRSPTGGLPGPPGAMPPPPRPPLQGIQPGQIFQHRPMGPGMPPPGWNLPPGAMPPQQAWLANHQPRPASAPILSAGPGALPHGAQFRPPGPPQPSMMYPGHPGPPIQRQMNHGPPGMPGMPHPPPGARPAQLPPQLPPLQLPKGDQFYPGVGQDLRSPPQGDPRRLQARSVSASATQPGGRSPTGQRPRPTEEDGMPPGQWQDGPRRPPIDGIPPNGAAGGHGR